jgi:hydroxymethylpyrimidine/phosphomethylpyrimidine kinase
VIPTVLSIAGSDPSGGAGIQADLKTFSALKVYGMAAIAALTAQNTTGVSRVMEVYPDFLAEQIDAVVTDIRPDAVKTGMLHTAANVEITAGKVREYGLSNLVIDPVISSTSGSRLLSGEAIDTMRRLLLPLALIVTPNLEEAAVLSGSSVKTPDDAEEAALQIYSLGPKYVFIKGGHLEGAAADLLFDGTAFTWLTADRVASTDTHGTGCVLSAAIAAYLARGESLRESVRMAKDVVTIAIRDALRLGKGSGPCDPIGIQRKG